MTLKYRIFILFVFLGSALFSQPYGNEWINYSQSYYRFPVVQAGVYKITYTDLQNAGFPVSTMDPRNIQLFGRGEEIALHIEGEGDGNFDASDFIEFYAEGNDGFADTDLYGSAADIAQPSYSLINDTIHYFITWNSSTNNKRLQAENDVNFGAYSAASYVWRNSLIRFTTNYFGGETESGGGTDPAYHPTEGWFDLDFNVGGGRSRSVPTSNRFTSGPSASIHWRSMGESDYSRLDLDHHLNVQFAGITFDTIFGGYQVIDKHFTAPTSSLGSSTTLFTFKSINDLGTAADRNTIAFIEVDYPHLPDFGGQTSFDFSVEDQGGQSKTYLSFTGFNNSGTVWIVDRTNNKRIKVNTSAPNHQALIPNSGGLKKCHLYSEGNINSVGGIKAVNGSGSFTDWTALEKSNGFLIITHNSLLASANQYAAYRNSKGFGALVADVDELYHQFAFGIRKHPLAIRGFVEFVSDNWTEQPSNLFLLGKSVNVIQHRKGGNAYKANLVPTYGNPSSDILLTAGLNQSLLDPLIPTGRLSAKNAAEVDLYLSKVMEYESNSSQAWMKNILHFAGGKSGAEANRFISYLESYEYILTDTSFGGNVLTFKKNTTAPIQISLSDSIRGLVNNGTSIMTFFGHASSTGGFDQNIDEPENYNNKGKYPILIGNSCFTGDIHDYQGNSVSERFVLIKDKGVIAFLASVDLGLEGKLNEYSRRFFQNLGQDNYGGSIGEHMKNSIKSLQTSGNNFPNRSVSLLMTLHGDPALVINAHDKPDYVITKNQVRTNPQPVTTKNDTFELKIQLFNYGKAIDDSLDIEVVRFFPDMSSETYFITSPPVYFEENVILKLPVDQVRGSGYNRLDISLDNSALIPELSETNNFVSVDFFIKSGDLIPAMPYEFAIVPEQGIELKASTGYAFEAEQQYEIQLDTNDSFSNPLETFSTTSRGGVISWKPSVLNNMKDSLVYFWRCRNTSGDENSIWRMSSFQYIKDKRGWSQDHFDQFKSNNKLFLEMDNAQREFYFSPSTKKLICQTLSITPGNYSPLGDVLYKLDADLQEYGGCGIGPAIHIAILDSLTFKPWGTPFQGQNANNDFGQINKNGNCGKNRVQNFFIFQANNASQLSGLKDMLQNKVPNGNYILAWTWIKNDFSDWDNIDPTLRSVFANLGADSISTITNDSIPYIFFVKKGQPSTAIEVLGQNSNEFIYMNASLQNNATYGSMRSAIIGPSSVWDSIHWRHFSLSNPSTDSLSLKMFGLAKDQQTVMADRTFKKSQKKVDISNMLNPSSAPYMNLDIYLSDNANQTAAQLDRWTVLYEGVMDLALNSNDQFEFHNDTIQEGDMLTFSTSIKNISDYDADSVLIRYYVVNRDRKQISIPYKRQRPLKADSSFISSIELNTLGLKGNNTLVVEVNPEFDQPEQHQFNNIGQLPFFVKGDNTNPILDVTFDGVHILDGDIISAKPEISIQLSDDNEFLALDDTSDFRVFVTNPQGQEKQYYFSNNNPNYSMEFMPASAGRNKARVQLSPVLTEDGKYALRVQATDKSKNESGDVDYRIGFEVINRSTITNLMNYPNPFSTSTRFVFILTGSKVPDNMQIQIMTVSGKIVKNITMGELGPIRIGRNITSYAWDGRDQYGDKLANGVYLYRVNTRLNGSEIDHRSTSADKYFKQGFGKMVILR